MSREIKFMGLMTTGEWVYGLPHLDLPNSTTYFNECSYRICWNIETGGQANAPIKNGTLSEFTGLKDKNGVEIYEGDIFKLGSENQLFDVRFQHGCFLAFKNGKQYGILGELIPAFIEVIGNIHQNIELL